jgi:hypothetical protein
MRQFIRVVLRSELGFRCMAGMTLRMTSPFRTLRYSITFHRRAGDCDGSESEWFVRPPSDGQAERNREARMPQYRSTHPLFREVSYPLATSRLEAFARMKKPLKKLAQKETDPGPGETILRQYPDAYSSISRRGRNLLNRRYRSLSCTLYRHFGRCSSGLSIEKIRIRPISF